MSDPTDSGEIDALKVYVYGMFAVAAVGAGLVWWLNGKNDDLRATIRSAREALPELATSKREIQNMVKSYTKNKEDEARDQPLTWFQTRWKEVGIPDQGIQLDAWKVPPDIGPDGSYTEEKIGLKFSNKNPLRRDAIGQFLHRVELNSSRLRVLTLQVRRTGRDETISDDAWTGQCEIGYRYPRARE